MADRTGSVSGSGTDARGHLSARSGVRLCGIAALRSGAPIIWPDTLLAKRAGPLRITHFRARDTIASPTRRVVFLLDCSASMLADGRLSRAKGLLLGWFRAIRRDDDEAVLICFGASEARVRFGPAVPRGWHAQWLAPIAGGGGTPLSLGLQVAAEVAGRTGRGGNATAARELTLVVLTDGRINEMPARPEGFEWISIVVPQAVSGGNDDRLLQEAGWRKAQRLAEKWRASVSSG